MTLQQTAKKFRAIADLLDDLLGVDRPTPRETPVVAAAIRRELSSKPHTYAGKHWTQQPKNKAKLRAMMKRGVETRKAAL